jgi:hypothetical protein
MPRKWAWSPSRRGLATRSVFCYRLVVLRKAHTHGGNIQAVLAPDGFPLWVSGVEPGSVHDITAARLHALPALCRAAAPWAGYPGRSRL